ncbi:MAG TPA: SRPBCC family protein [Devosiaceae bacterium]|jgi:uncharacterized protein YndB with AHSA1/START domain|nr:SRPBCC family protein [Devosiaceae bacterium]
MTFDLAAHLGAMSRTVRNLERDGKPAKAVIVSRIYETNAADLWDALSSRERLPRWFLPVSGELKPGGRYQFEGNAGGTITECTPEERLAATWEFAGNVSWVTVTLEPEGDGTRLTLEHTAHVDETWEKQFGPGATGVGWDGGFMGLARHLATGEAVTADAAEYHLTPEGRAFYATAAKAWAEADIKAGKPEADAQEAGERTRQFYTGEGPPPEM